MFFRLVGANNRRNRKDNALYFSSMVISVIAFYIILSLSNQDVMIFLSRMESDAVSRLLSIIPVFYVATLFILFFLVYFSISIKTQKRNRELGIYLTLGMKKSGLFKMIYFEELFNDIRVLAIGLPSAIMISELISLTTSKIVGLGIIGHRFSLSISAIIFTIAGFLAVKSLVVLIIGAKLMRKDIGDLLYYSPVVTKRQYPQIVYVISMVIGVFLLARAYHYGISGGAWMSLESMGITVALGISGTISVFFGLRLVLEFWAKLSKKKRLHNFNIRQIQEMVINRSTILALCSLLIFAALCLFAVGAGTAANTTNDSVHVMDYTFINDSSNKDLSENSVREVLKEKNIDNLFEKIFEVRLGQTKPQPNVFNGITNILEKQEESKEKDIMLNNFKSRDGCYLISLSGYNEIMKTAHLAPLRLSNEEGALYVGGDFLHGKDMMDNVMSSNPRLNISGRNLKLVGDIQSLPVVTDRAITLSYALIVNDEVFKELTKGDYFKYLNGVLDSKTVKDKGLMSAIMDVNSKLENTTFEYESYMQNIGRYLFYVIAASYITIYLAIIFFVVANTIMGVMFLMSQRVSYRRYQTLVYLGATYDVLCQSSQRQINNYFGLAIFVAVVNSFFGIRSLLMGILPPSVRENLRSQLLIAVLTVILLAFFELIYMYVVKKSGNKFLLTLMEPKREE